MNYKAHQIGGLSLGTSAAILKYGLPSDSRTALVSLFIISAASLGALLPDIDEPSSKAGSKTVLLSKSIKATTGHRGFFHSPLAAGLLWMMLQAGEKILPVTTDRTYLVIGLIAVLFLGSMLMIEKKRGSMLVLLMYGLIAFLWLKHYQSINPGEIYRNVAEGLEVGYVSHLLMDMTNKAGIPLLYPLNPQKFHFMSLKTNKDELAAEILFGIPTVYLIVSNLS